MINPNTLFEVEIRCQFSHRATADEILPFLDSCLNYEKVWTDTYYGLRLFKSGQVLRISDVAHGCEEKHFLGWKEPDVGEFANIRQELDEEITTEAMNSTILTQRFRESLMN